MAGMGGHLQRHHRAVQGDGQQRQLHRQNHRRQRPNARQHRRPDHDRLAASHGSDSDCGANAQPMGAGGAFHVGGIAWCRRGAPPSCLKVGHGNEKRLQATTGFPVGLQSFETRLLTMSTSHPTGDEIHLPLQHWRIKCAMSPSCAGGDGSWPV